MTDPVVASTDDPTPTPVGKPEIESFFRKLRKRSFTDADIPKLSNATAALVFGFVGLATVAAIPLTAQDAEHAKQTTFYDGRPKAVAEWVDQSYETRLLALADHNATLTFDVTATDVIPSTVVLRATRITDSKQATVDSCVDISVEGGSGVVSVPVTYRRQQRNQKVTYEPAVGANACTVGSDPQVVEVPIGYVPTATISYGDSGATAVVNWIDGRDDPITASIPDDFVPSEVEIEATPVGSDEACVTLRYSSAVKTRVVSGIVTRPQAAVADKRVVYPQPGTTECKTNDETQRFTLDVTPADDFGR